MASSLSSAMRSIRFCGSVCALLLAHDVHHGWNGRCVNSCFALLLKRFTWCRKSFLHLLRQKLCRLQLDPQQPRCTTASLRLNVLCFSNSTHVFEIFAIPQLARMNFALPKLAHMTVVILHLVQVLLHEVCFNSIVAQVTDTQDRYCHVYHMELISFQMISNSLTRFFFCLPWSVLPSAPRSRTEPS